MPTTKDIIRRLFEDVLNGGRHSLLNDLIHPDYVDHTPPGGQEKGVAGVRAKIDSLRRAFPDVAFDLETLVAEGDLVAVRYHWRGTQTGEFLHRPASGKKVSVSGMDFYRIKDGQILEHWDISDQLALFQQLGLKI